MIIAFSFENWLSFRDKAAFSMVASRERQHGKRLARLGKYQMRILPVTAVYGGNASGKTNFFAALNFAKRLVVDGTRLDRPIPVAPFRLDAESATRPSRFECTLLIDETIYAFSFAVTRKAVLEEKLVKITSTSEKTLYRREQDNDNPDFHPSLNDQERLKFVFEGTRDNQLFLTNAVSQKVEAFRPVYDWFRNTLQLVAPDTRFGRFERFFDEKSPLHSEMSEKLSQLDTGIVRLGSEELLLGNTSLPEELKTRIREELKEGETVHVLDASNTKRFVLKLKDGELIARKLVSYHRKDDGDQVKFDIRQESDGSRRLIELLPAFLDLSRQAAKKVYVIDEIDRSLHPLLIRELLETYLGDCGADGRSQLLLTTHNVLLMDQELLRRDEMWVVERDADGTSSLIPFSDYEDIRYDKDIRKSYLQGRLGGVPRILPGVNPDRSARERTGVAEKT